MTMWLSLVEMMQRNKTSLEGHHVTTTGDVSQWDLQRQRAERDCQGLLPSSRGGIKKVQSSVWWSVFLKTAKRLDTNLSTEILLFEVTYMLGPI